MLPSKRARVQELVNQLQARVNSSTDVSDFLQLFKLRLEEAKDNLVTCTATEFPMRQAEAQVYEKLIRDLTRVNPLDAKER